MWFSNHCKFCKEEPHKLRSTRSDFSRPNSFTNDFKRKTELIDLRTYSPWSTTRTPTNVGKRVKPFLTGRVLENIINSKRTPRIYFWFKYISKTNSKFHPHSKTIYHYFNKGSEMKNSVLVRIFPVLYVLAKERSKN